MFLKQGDMYTISIFITNTMLVVVTAAGVEVFMVPPLSFRLSAKLRDGATAANLSPAFKSVRFHAATVVNLAPSIDFFICAMADASLSLGNTMMDTIDLALPAGMVAMASITFPSSPRSPTASHNPLNNYPAPASMKMQYIS
ncbi:LOW QUALITY PROTEIN: hypothetical protein CFC21_013668 [Triticum aestivum]|uniref:Uncharacterized protein n=2 Tax=Triticum aestivum TaxID=4565 RepID=A0A3B6A214_WHEAT|nr:LOW QUALITY PROTEIN: hypothetical protein CFC21_013668 [Triticum aestivum]